MYIAIRIYAKRDRHGRAREGFLVFDGETGLRVGFHRTDEATLRALYSELRVAESIPTKVTFVAEKEREAERCQI